MRRILIFATLPLLLLHGQPPAQGKRKALIIGNGIYFKLPALKTANQDARAIGDALSKTGFTIALEENVDKRQMVAAIDSFLSALQPADTVFVYFSGYAVQSEGQNFLLPANFNPAIADAIDSGYSLLRLQTYLAKKQVGLKIIVVDAAYTSPELSQLVTAPGLATPFVDKESIVVLPTLPGRTITPAPGLTESVFVTQMVAALGRPGLTSEQLFENVSKSVRAATKGEESPTVLPNVLNAFYFRDALPVEVVKIAPVKKIETSLTNPKDKLVYQLIPAGTFQMGCVAGDHECGPDETTHKVTLSHEFWIGATEVPVVAYRYYAAHEHVRVPSLEMLDKTAQKRLKMSNKEGEDYPIINVSWQDAKAFCTSSGGRLPSEAEWEDAARGGLDGKIYPWGDKITHDDAKYENVERSGYDTWLLTAPVKSFPANGYGLFNMPGNTREWVNDFYDVSYYGKPDAAKDPSGPSNGAERVVRGGYYQSKPSALRNSAREHFPPATARIDLSFRCVMDQRPDSK